MNVIQLNKFADLHDGEKIIFCKTDYIAQEFDNISKKNHDVVLITGNSDYCITDDIVLKAPKNIKKWFCQNRLSDSFLLQSLPLGIENSVDCVRSGHGHGWPHAIEKLKTLSKPPTKQPSGLIYANFSINTNRVARQELKNKSIEIKHITWHEPDISYPSFVQNILEHEATLCAQGNGMGDNHRIYETLYLSRVPITFSQEQYRYLHNLFPTVLISDIDMLEDYSLMRSKLDSCYKLLNKKYLDFDYWKDMILDSTGGI